MLSQKMIISNNGICAKGINSFIHVAEQFKSGIWIESGGHCTNAKSVLGLLSAQIKDNSVITLLADGVDEYEAINALAEIVSSF